jgi:hypothetical protein
MKNREKLLPVVLLTILLSLFVIHFTQYQFSWKYVEPLNGYYLKAEENKFTWKNWFSGSYQEVKDKYLNDHFGFRNYFIRINHQLRFSLFNKIKTAWVTVGKENYLYEFQYIKAYYGADFIGHDSIEKRMFQTRFLQDTLNRLEKKLIIILAPGKGSFYPQYIPDKPQYVPEEFLQGIHPTNIEVYRQYIEKYQINCIDFHQYFIDNKNDFVYPLFPQYGIHWSIYTSCLAADSIVRYIEKTNNITIPHIYWDKINMRQPIYRDRDIADAMNLLFSPRTFDMAYPELKFESDSGKTKPSLLVVADSYYGTIFDLGLDDVFSNHHWWYYNEVIYPESHDDYWLLVNDINYHQEMLNYDIIMILSTDANLPNLGWGFIEYHYNKFHGQSE